MYVFDLQLKLLTIYSSYSQIPWNLTKKNDIYCTYFYILNFRIIDKDYNDWQQSATHSSVICKSEIYPQEQCWCNSCYLPQTLQRNGDSSECNLKCFLRSLFSRNAFPQTEHRHGRSTECVLTCNANFRSL
jgi:hypothetical protein